MTIHNNNKFLTLRVTTPAHPVPALAPKGSNIAPIWYQHRAKTSPSISKIEPRWGPEAPKANQNGAEMGSRRLKHRNKASVFVFRCLLALIFVLMLVDSRNGSPLVSRKRRVNWLTRYPFPLGLTWEQKVASRASRAYGGVRRGRSQSVSHLSKSVADPSKSVMDPSQSVMDLSQSDTDPIQEFYFVFSNFPFLIISIFMFFLFGGRG